MHIGAIGLRRCDGVECLNDLVDVENEERKDMRNQSPNPYMHPLKGILITIGAVCGFLLFLVLVIGLIRLIA